jgi:hypothetical protein
MDRERYLLQVDILVSDTAIQYSDATEVVIYVSAFVCFLVSFDTVLKGQTLLRLSRKCYGCCLTIFLCGQTGAEFYFGRGSGVCRPHKEEMSETNLLTRVGAL